MSTCSAAEIAVKKRIALEKLRAKKAGQLQEKPSSSCYKTKTTPASVGNVANNQQKQSPTSASTEFLNALKQCSTFGQRTNAARNTTHPYQRPTTHNKPQQQLAKPALALPAAVFVKTISCKLYLINQLRFAVQTSSYHAKLIEIFKTIPSKSYDNNTRIWDFALKDYELLQERVKPLKPEVVLGTIPRFVLNLCAAPAKQTERSCLMSIEENLATKLMPFQQEGVCFAIAQGGRLMICDEMGLGKTYQALAIADFYKENWPLFICTTASTRDSWSVHVRELLPSIPLHYIQTLTSNQQYIGDAKVLITSYSMMDRHMKDLLARRFGVLIFDESHTLKNNKTNSFSAAQRLAKQARQVILLSGTPALSRPVELFTQLQLVDPKFMNYIDYTTRYCDGQQTNFGWTAMGQSNLEELNVLLKIKYMIRRTKAEVLPQLAEKLRETVLLDSALVWHNNDTKETLNNFAKHLSASKGREKEEILLKFYAQTAEVKTRAVCAYLKTLVKDNIKFIVFAHHRIMLDAICECLDKLNVNFIRIDGTTKNDARAEYINRFQNKSKCQVAVLSLRACNSGITLTAAEMIIFAELDWNPSTLAQAESRAHRIGQEKAVVCRYLMASNTADDVIWNMLKNKQDVLNRAGLFCENLQEATHTAAPTMSHKIEQYFSPVKTISNGMAANENEAPLNNNNNNNNVLSDKNKQLKTPDISLSQELKNIDEFFNDDDDDFKDFN